MLHDVDKIELFGADARQPVESLQFRRYHNVGALAVTALATYVAITIAYFAYRLPLWNPEAPILSGLMLAAELFGVMTLSLHVFSTWSLVERRAPPPPAGYEADILITTWNESAEILRNTLLAAKQVRHARAVWLLDDGCRKEMEDLARELDVRYIARTDRSHAKAGNLNNALKFTDAPFVAIFDCDHAPSPEFLERTLGYFVDPKVAFVQTPQDFYNTGSFQHRGSAHTKEAWHEQTLFYRVIQPGKDRWNAGFFCGSCAIMRKTALEDIGGIATGTITEDMHTSLRIHKNGWSSVYHSEALAFGLSPATLDQYDTQRLRWARGAMQVWLKEGILFRGNLTLPQRLAYFMSTITYFEGWQKAIVYFLPMFVLLTGEMPIIWAGWPFIGIFLTWFLSGVIVNEMFSRGYAKTLWTEEYNFFRYYTFMKATLALVIPIKWRFSVTPKGMDIDRNLPLRLWPQFVVAIGAMASMVIGTLIYRQHHHMPEGAFIANLIWLTINATIAIKAISFAANRRHQKRAEHRFPLPLIARIEMVGKDNAPQTLGVAYDISSRGMSLEIAGGGTVNPEIQGQLMLPGGSAPFRGRVQRQLHSQDGRKTILGLQFAWVKDSDADPLNRCLYGNTLQWDVNDWSEVRRFRLSRLWRAEKDMGGAEWKIGHVHCEGKRLRCLTRRENGGFRILSFDPLPQGADYRLRINGRNEEGLHLAGYREYSVGGGRVCLTLLHGNPERRIHFHREPKWMRAKGTA